MNEINQQNIKTITCKVCNKQFIITNIEEWKNNKFQCSICNIDYCILPKSERELRILQDQYLQTREEKHIRQMFYILEDYVKSIIKKKYGRTIKFEEGEIEEKSRDVVSLVLQRYCKPDFKVEISFCKYFEFKILEVLYPQKEKKQQCVDSLDYEFEDGNQVEHEDKKFNIDSILDNEEKLNICNEFCMIIDLIKSECKSRKMNYIRLLNIANFLDNNNNYIQDFFEVFAKKDGKLMVLKTINLLREELKSRLK